MMKQGFWVNKAIHYAYNSGIGEGVNEDGMVDWLLHMDPDELFHPEDVTSVSDTVVKNETDASGVTYLHSSLSMLSTFEEIDEDICMVNFLNYEAIVEHRNVEKRFEEITLVKGNSKFMTEEAKNQRLGLRLGDNVGKKYQSDPK